MELILLILLSFVQTTIVVAVHLIPLVVYLLLVLKLEFVSELNVLTFLTALFLSVFLIFVFGGTIVVDSGWVEIGIHLLFNFGN